MRESSSSHSLNSVSSRSVSKSINNHNQNNEASSRLTLLTPPTLAPKHQAGHKNFGRQYQFKIQFVDDSGGEAPGGTGGTANFGGLSAQNSLADGPLPPEPGTPNPLNKPRLTSKAYASRLLRGNNFEGAVSSSVNEQQLTQL